MRAGRERVWAALALTALLCVFFGRALVRFSEVHYSSSDISQASTWTTVDADADVRPSNQLLSDPYTQMEPWAAFNARELSSGRVPLWNPWNAGGEPHLANYQSAVFSPFTWPHYVLPTRAALLATAYLKLFVAGFFTFLFLRRIGCASPAAFVGALVYAFSGHNVLLLPYPHSGAAAAAPAALYFLEGAFQRFERADRGVVTQLALFALALALGLLAGHPEAIFFVVVLVALYASWRLVTISRSHARVRGLTLATLAALSLAAGVAAVQIVPFLEYLDASHVVHARVGTQTPLLLKGWSLFFFPDLVGNPSSDYNLGESLPTPNYETANMSYCGALAVFLAFASWAWARTSRYLWFFTIVLAAWFVCAFNVLGCVQLISHIPLATRIPLNRSQHMGAFAAAVLAGLAVDGLLRVAPSWKRACVTLAAGLAMLALWSWRASVNLAYVYDYLKAFAWREQIWTKAPPHIEYVSITFAIGVAAAASVYLVRGTRVRAALACVIALVCFAQTGWLLRNYNPVCEDRYFHPRTPLVAALQEKVGDDPFVIFGDDTIPPDANMQHGLRMLSAYDAMWVARYDELYRVLFGETHNWRNSIRASERALVMFGARQVLSRSGWLPVSTAFVELPPRDKVAFELRELVPGDEVVQEFTGLANGLCALTLAFRSNDPDAAGPVELVLEDVQESSELVRATFLPATCTVTPDGIRHAAVSFPRIANSQDRALRLRVSAPNARPGSSITLLGRKDLARYVNNALWRVTMLRSGTIPKPSSERHPDLERWRTMQGATEYPGGLDFDVSTAQDVFEPIDFVGDFQRFRYTRSLGRFFSVDSAVSAPDDQHALALVMHTNFDPRRVVVITGADANPQVKNAPPGRPARRVSETPQQVTIEVEREKPGWLVTSDAWFPGWKVAIDGVEAPLLRVNYAFRGVAVPAGTHTVRFEYAPWSFTIGAWTSGLCALALAAWVYHARRGSCLPGVTGAA